MYVWNRSCGLVLDILRVGLGRVTRGIECKKALHGLVSFSSRRFIGATKRDPGNAHALKKCRDGPSREDSYTGNQWERDLLLLSSLVRFFSAFHNLNFVIASPLFQIIIYIFLHRSFPSLLIFSFKVKIRYIHLFRFHS